MKDTSDDTRQKAILNSAFQAFSKYGFRKTSMDDIARGAGMSRPAVYLHYKNKEAIVRKLTELHYEEKTAVVTEALNGTGTISEIVTRAIHAQTEGMAAILASPHGLEMLDTTKSMSIDIVEQGEAKLADLYAAWLAREQAAGRVRLFESPEETAKTITVTLKGIKMTASGAEEFEKHTAQLAALIGAGLEIR
ncbi:TetR/AcrR family transcriptional regulator [Rhodobacteraceae bacterium B1Z28]|uniref:TetR/AcrR family transcriptional regulator n=1 Tax=Ruegeria haliotis TaxID=2747601 RepID=A0ABX2PKI0_9RHOB|nr:TetR/AcrR family transcriptional regulator [Ruegeria haliotis]NVO54615.1 TetR/AcrR family transcriptional regulator [Ruegeria haliotis]